VGSFFKTHKKSVLLVVAVVALSCTECCC